MAWVIVKIGNHGRTHYVAKPGMRKSYTTSIKQARKYNTREEALANKCALNEQVRRVEDEIA